MNKLKKIYQCIKYRRHILGRVGDNNKFRPNILITSAAIIGSNNYLGDRVMIGNARIGNYCSIAPDAKIGQSQHSMAYVTTFQNIAKKNIEFSLNHKRAVIGNDVWIGANAVIMQGVTVGNGAVIGANAVVTHDVPSYSIVVGIPARVLKYRFSEETIKVLEASRWWEYGMREAAEKVKDLEKYIEK